MVGSPRAGQGASFVGGKGGHAVMGGRCEAKEKEPGRRNTAHEASGLGMSWGKPTAAVGEFPFWTLICRCYYLSLFLPSF